MDRSRGWLLSENSLVSLCCPTRVGSCDQEKWENRVSKNAIKRLKKEKKNNRRWRKKKGGKVESEKNVAKEKKKNGKTVERGKRQELRKEGKNREKRRKGRKIGGKSEGREKKRMRNGFAKFCLVPLFRFFRFGLSFSLIV